MKLQKKIGGRPGVYFGTCFGGLTLKLEYAIKTQKYGIYGHFHGAKSHGRDLTLLPPPYCSPWYNFPDPGLRALLSIKSFFGQLSHNIRLQSIRVDIISKFDLLLDSFRILFYYCLLFRILFHNYIFWFLFYNLLLFGFYFTFGYYLRMLFCNCLFL